MLGGAAMGTGGATTWRATGVITVGGCIFPISGKLYLSEGGGAAAARPTQTRERDDEDSDDEQEQRGPSRRVMSTEQGRQPIAPLPPHSAPPPSLPMFVISGSAAATSQAWQAHPGPAAAGIVLVSGVGPSTFKAMPEPLMAQAPPNAFKGKALQLWVLPGIGFQGVAKARRVSGWIGAVNM